MYYFIGWAVFALAVILATIIVAVISQKQSTPARRSAVQPESDENVNEAEFDDGSMEMQGEEFEDEAAVPVGDDFAEFENEFK